MRRNNACLTTLLTAFYFGQKRTGFFGRKAREQGDGIASFKADMSARRKIDIADFFVGSKGSECLKPLLFGDYMVAYGEGIICDLHRNGFRTTRAAIG